MKSCEKLSKLALGTAQFGLHYGIANQQGQVCVEVVGEILETAYKVGVTTLDTAIAYGESERVLGNFDLSSFAVITKLSALPQRCSDVAGWVESEFKGSLQRLKLNQLDGLLLHRPQQLLNAKGHALYRALESLRDQGLVRSIGISIYDSSELDQLCQRYSFDLVQAPFNILDRRMVETGWLDRFADQGTRLHVRSIFLQGLLLMSSQARPQFFDRWNALWQLWGDWLHRNGMTPLQACLRHALSQKKIERVVVGVESVEQWQQILEAATGSCPAPPIELGTTEVELLNPTLWKTT